MPTDTTRRYPRTLSEAFGPYVRGGVVHPMPEPRRPARRAWVALADAICWIAAAAILAVLIGAALFTVEVQP